VQKDEQQLFYDCLDRKFKRMKIPRILSTNKPTEVYKKLAQKNSWKSLVEIIIQMLQNRLYWSP